MSDIIELSKISIGYANEIIMAGISLKIVTGEVVSLLGNNGSGKSTLGKTIAGLIPKLKGELFIRGKTIESYSRKELSKIIRYVPSELYLPEYMTVIDFVRLDATNDASMMMLREVGIEKLKERYMTELSSGERQKVMIAAALASESEVVILDEPLAHLDRKARIEVLELLKNMAKNRSVSFIVITHEWELAEQYSNRRLIMENDELKEMNLC